MLQSLEHLTRGLTKEEIFFLFLALLDILY